MKKRYLIILLIATLITTNSVFSADFFPETGFDPFFSELDPTYQDEDMRHEHDTVINFWKKKKQEFVQRKENKKVQPANKGVTQRQKFVMPPMPVVKQETEAETIDVLPSNEVPAVNQKKSSDNKIEETSLNLDEINDISADDTENTDEGLVETSDDTFVTPEKKKMTNKELEKAIMEEEREKQREIDRAETKAQYKALKDKFNIFKRKKKPAPEPVVEPNIELTADYMEYFPDRFEVEAIGNARVFFKAQNTTLTAHKIVFNYDRNILKAHEDVVLISPTSTTEGDFVKLDLSKPNGWIENPITSTEDIQLSAKEAFLYSDKIEEYDGVAKIIKDDVVKFGGRSFAAYIDETRVFPDPNYKLSDASKGVYKIKANKIIIDSKKDHEVITIKNADLYLKNHRIAAIPSVRIVTNKEHASAETNLPEIGSMAMLGMHVGPAVVLNVPGGSTLKLAPILTYKNDKLGFGGIARFRNSKNMTEIAYGTSVDQIVIRGKQKFAPGWSLEYSRYANQSEWFLGYRMPKYGAQLSYSRSDYVPDLQLQFSQKYSAGVFIDKNTWNHHTDYHDAEARFRWMTNTYKPFYSYMNEEGTVGLQTGLVAQTAATVYTSGETLGLFRFGPAIRTKLGPWHQAVMFYETATAGKNSPFYFDRYRYGRSNFVIIENLKVCKYLTLGYMGSLAFNSDYDDKMFQESRIMVGVGPEYARVIVGYDAKRRNTMLLFTMLVGTKDSDVEFKKSEVINPDKIGKDRSKQKKEKKTNYRKFLNKNVPIVIDKKK